MEQATWKAMMERMNDIIKETERETGAWPASVPPHQIPVRCDCKKGNLVVEATQEADKHYRVSWRCSAKACTQDPNNSPLEIH